MSEIDQASKEACRFIREYYRELGRLAPDKFSIEEQHAIVVLAAYIRAQPRHD